MRNQLKFTIVLLIIGFMAAVQYNTVQNPKERDTRDIWAIRHELATEKQLHSELLSEIRELDKTIYTYESLEDENTGLALMETVDKLYQQAGMTDIDRTRHCYGSASFSGKHCVWHADYREYLQIFSLVLLMN